MPTFSGMSGLKNNLLKKNYLEVKQQLANTGSANANPVSLSFATSANSTVSIQTSGGSDLGNFIALSISNNELAVAGITYDGRSIIHTRTSTTSNWNTGAVAQYSTSPSSNGYPSSIVLRRDPTMYLASMGLSTSSVWWLARLVSPWGRSIKTYGIYVSTTEGLSSAQQYGSLGHSSAFTLDGTRAVICTNACIVTLTENQLMTSELPSPTSLLITNQVSHCPAIAICNICNTIIAASRLDNGSVLIFDYTNYTTIPITSWTTVTLYDSNNIALSPISSIEFLWFSTTAPPTFVFFRTANGSYIYNFNPITRTIGSLVSSTTLLRTRPTKSTISGTYRTNSNGTYIQDSTTVNGQSFINKLRMVNLVEASIRREYYTVNINPLW